MNPLHEATLVRAQGMSTESVKAHIVALESMTAQDMPPPLETGEQRRQWTLASLRFELRAREDYDRRLAEVSCTPEHCQCDPTPHEGDER